MVKYVLGWARNTGLYKVFLSVFDSNKRAIELYRKAGFVQEGRRPCQYMINGQCVAEILMGLLL